MAKTKEIQRRIKSVNNTKKITKAMEMVAASKMRKSVEAVLKTRTYANLAWVTVLNIAGASDSGKNLHPLLNVRSKIKKVAIFLISSNRGLCGSFNSNIINKAVDSIKKHGNIDTDFIIIGKKGLAVNSRFKYKIEAEFQKTDFISQIKEITPIAKLLIDEFLAEKYDKVFVAYTDFVNNSKQVPRIKQVLPVDISAEDEYLGVVGKDDRVGSDKKYIAEKESKYLRDNGHKYIFTYEPGSEEVLNQMLPRLIEVQLFQALLESNASEHSVRMTAMHQATEAADDLAKELVLFYNKARQSAITSEIAEISAGANALKR
ncbi:MAG: ATP synthase F1 subunit gamma [Patescibacteria group bacterium]|jgi:F-type H+-transporting ATPase subunit gamma